MANHWYRKAREGHYNVYWPFRRPRATEAFAGVTSSLGKQVRMKQGHGVKCPGEVLVLDAVCRVKRIESSQY